VIDLRSLATAGSLPIVLPAETRLTLIAVRLDDPLAYVFESADWRSAIGAAKQVQALGTRLSAALPAGSLVLSGVGDQSCWIALASELPPDWANIAQLATESTGLLTAIVVGLSLTARQVFQGLYRAPTALIGIPGMATHQARVNAYYGVVGGTTTPDAASIADRRHFGEALALLDQLIDRAHADRDTFPFIECLPVVIRCPICRTRPVEIAGESNTLCAICQRKRSAAGVVPAAGQALAVISARAIGVDGTPVEAILRQSTTPAAYLRLSRLLSSAWAAIDAEADRALPAIPIWRTSGESWWIVPLAQALTFASAIAKKFTAAVGHWPDEVPRLTVQIGVGCDRPGQVGAAHTYQAVIAALHRLNRSPDRLPRKPAIAIESGWAITDHRPRYTPDMAAQLQSAVQQLHQRQFPAAQFADLPEQVARHTANLYYDARRAGLEERARQVLDSVAVEYASTWGAQTDSFFAALCDTFGLLSALDTPRSGLP